MTVLLIAVAFVILIVIGAIVVGFLCEEPDEDLTTINKGDKNDRHKRESK